MIQTLVFIPGRTGINNVNPHHIDKFYFYPNFTQQIWIYVMMQVLVLSFRLCDVQIMQKDYALFSFDDNKVHANIITFFWGMTAVLFSIILLIKWGISVFGHPWRSAATLRYVFPYAL